MSQNVIVYLLLIPLLAAASAGESPDIFPETFTDVDINQYTVRYVSPNGTDSEECLQSQPHPSLASGCQQPDAALAASRCRTMAYGLLGRCFDKNYTMCTPGVTSNLIVLFYPGEYIPRPEYGVILADYTNVIIRKIPLCGENREDEVIFSCFNFTEMHYNNLYFIDVVNLGIDGIVFSKCGPYSPGSAMIGAHNATITNCEFRDNQNSGFVVYTSYNTLFQNCTFKDNICTLAYDEGDGLTPGGYRYAGGLTVLWTNQPDFSVLTHVKNCSFINNTANVSSSNDDDLELRPNLYILRGHGGALLVAFNNASNNTLLVEDSQFINNTALFNGGGIFVSFYNESYENQVIINRTTIDGNRCNSVGGGISMNTFEVADSNHLIVENSNFTNNSAWTGGGAFSINLQDNLSPTNYDQLVIDNVGVFGNCIFEGNRSPIGGSTGSLVSNARVDQVSAPTTFIDCKFLYNVGPTDASYGTLMAFRFPISLTGSNVFRGNMGGGVALLQSQLNNHGRTLFDGNVARNGGAMGLRDFSVIQLFNESTMTFINNVANYRGGAISVRSASVGIDSDIIRLFNTRCFIQYDIEGTDPSLFPYEWNATLTFTNNTAKNSGSAIYATDVERCTYAPSLNEPNTSNSYSRSMFRLQDIFIFNQNSLSNVSLGNNSLSNVSNETLPVSTAPSWFRVEPKGIEGAPGEIVTFTISAVDGSNNWQRAIWNINEGDESDIYEEYFALEKGEQKYDYAICKESMENCVPKNDKDLRFSIVQIIAGSVSNITHVKLNVIKCHPGYYQDKNRCLVVNDTNLILRADERNRYVYIKRQFYAAYNVSGDPITIHAVIPIPFQKCINLESKLSGCLFKYDQPNDQCVDGREGFLCGRCKQNNTTQYNSTGSRGVDLTLIQCADCTPVATFLVVFVVILFTVTCALILIYNIGIPNELRGCLFFIQVVGFVYQYRVGEELATWDYHLARVFGSGLYLPLCPLPGADALYTTAYGLLLPAVAIITIVVYIISARFIKLLSNKNSFDGIWFLTFIIYKFTADTCFNILRCQRVSSDEDGEFSEYRYFYDGTHICFSTEDKKHLYFALVAMILGIAVVLFTVLVIVISFKRFKMTQQLTDILNKDLKQSCRWWGSFDLFRRLFFILVVLIFNYIHPQYSQLALLYSGLFVFFVFACALPYDSMKANLVETLVLLDLLILTSLFLDTSKQKQTSVRPFAYIFLLIPFISIAIYIGYALLRYAWNKWCPLSIKDVCSEHKEKFLTKVNLKQEVYRFVSYEPESTVSPGEFALTDSTHFENGELQTDYEMYREELLDEN